MGSLPSLFDKPERKTQLKVKKRLPKKIADNGEARALRRITDDLGVFK